MSKPRVALIFGGQPRCIDGLSYDGFQKCILSQYDVDVYAHFWGDIETGKSSGKVAENIERFKELYNPKAIRIDPPLTAKEFPLEFVQRHSPTPVTYENIMNLQPIDSGYWRRNTISMYTSMSRAYDVFESSSTGQYDWIIRARTDCVLLRCPRLEALDSACIYAPDWHGPNNPVIVNHVLIMSPSIAPTLFRIRSTVGGLRGKVDETFVYNHLWVHGFLDRVRTLPMSVFYPTLTRDGIQTDKPEPDMESEIIEPPYEIARAPSSLIKVGLRIPSLRYSV